MEAWYVFKTDSSICSFFLIFFNKSGVSFLYVRRCWNSGVSMNLSSGMVRSELYYGLQPEPAPCTPESLISGFSWAKVPKQDVCLPEGLF